MSDTITQLLKSAQAGDRNSLDDFLPLVYDELRRLANSYLNRERDNHTLQPTALVHEAYLRLIDQHSVDWKNRSHFFGLAAEIMRRILVNHAVHRNRQKREGELVRVTIDKAVNEFAENELNLIELDEALHRLAKLSERQARIFELRFFGGLSVEEVAEVLEISQATIKREWQVAKMFLQRELFQK